MANTKMTDKQKVTTMADSDYVFGNFGGKVGQMSILDFICHLKYDSTDSPDLSALLRKVDANTTRISSVEDKNTEQDEKIAGLKSALVSQILSQVQENIFALCDSDGNIALKYDNLGFDVAKISEHFCSLLSNSISGKNLLQVIEVDEPGLYYVDAELNVGEKHDKTGTHAINLVEYINQ